MPILFFLSLQGGVITAIFTARPSAGATAACPGTVSIDADWLLPGQHTLHELSMRDPGPTCGDSGGAQTILPAAFWLLPPPAAVLKEDTSTRSTAATVGLQRVVRHQPADGSVDRSGDRSGKRTIQWNISCISPGVSTFATMLVVESVAAGARDFIAVATGGTSRSDE